MSSASCGVTDLKMQYQNIVMQCFVSVNDAEEGETVEFKQKTTEHYWLKIFETQFPNVHGLRYKPAGKTTWRAVRRVGNSFRPPTGGWGCTLYTVVAREPGRNTIFGFKCYCSLLVYKIKEKM